MKMLATANGTKYGSERLKVGPMSNAD